MIAAIIQARMGSSRLPGKILKKISGKTMLEHIIERVKKSKYINKIIIATSEEKEDNCVEELLKNINVQIFRGHKYDVLSRYYNSAKIFNVEYIVRICADCPLIDPKTIDLVIKKHLNNNFEYTTNSTKTFPLGLDLEVLHFNILSKIYELAQEKMYREQVTFFIEQNPNLFTIQEIKACKNLNYPDFRLTVDTEEDLKLIKTIYSKLYDNINIVNINDVIKLMLENSALKKINANIAQKSKKDVDLRYVD